MSTITIIVHRGTVSDVLNLPQGWNYEIVDLDNDPELKEKYGY